ncbi:MAG: hypothetical protein HUJ92_08470 [Bacteroidales bacterium]|nr:hypothetical protein [Bacteroidales bacterium]
MKNFNHNITLLLVALAAFAASCSKVDDSGTGKYMGDELYATIEDGMAYIPETKAKTHDVDKFSTQAFEPGDEISFFADGGYDSYLGKQKDPVVDNWKLRRGASSFTPVDPTQVLDFNRMTRASCFYPYIEDPNNIPLRIQRTIDGETYTECVDLLYAAGINPSAGYISMSFIHRFNMIILIGGTGFTRLADPDWNDPRKDIYVTMNRPMTYAKLVTSSTTSGYNKYPTIPKDQPGTEEDKRFYGHKGPYFQDYIKPYTQAIYIITPADNTNAAIVEYITAKDDNGVSRTVSFVSRDQYNDKVTGTNYHSNYSKYPTIMEIVENVPTARPAIVPWDDDVEIVGREDQKGIDSPSDFKNWMMAYNNGASEAELLKYGDKVVIEKEGVVVDSYYRFYLNCDVDLKDVISSLSEMTALIDNLKDQFDGQGHALKNVVFTNAPSGNCSIFKNISGEHAKVSNLTVEGLKFNTPDNTAAMGVLATNLTKGTVENVKVKGIDVITGGTVGALAASISNDTDVTVKGCEFHGSMIGTGTVDKILASGTVSTPVKNGVSTANLIFMQKQ